MKLAELNVIVPISLEDFWKIVKSSLSSKDLEACLFLLDAIPC